MISDITKHKIDYSILAVGSSLYIFYVLQNQTEKFSLFLGTITFSLFYVVWGVFHHHRTKSLRAKVVLEYLLIAGLAVAIASTLLL